MNWDRIEGNWEKFKGRAREAWGKLTDDELQQAKGNRQQLAGIIQERYGYTKDQVERELDRFADAEEQTERESSSRRGL